MALVLLTSDLTAISRIEGAARKAGMTTRAVSSETAAIEACAVEQSRLLVIDLSAPLADIASFVGQIKERSSPPRIVAFGPHVHENRLAAAREAGCDEVLSRGQFFAQIDFVVHG